MITSSDSFYTYDLGKYYTIIPSTHNWKLDEFIKEFKLIKLLIIQEFCKKPFGIKLIVPVII